MMTERDSKIIDLYLNHPEIPLKEIAKNFGISTATISRIARINNLPRRTGLSYRVYLTEEQEKDIINEYQNKKSSMLQIQKKYNITYERLNELLKKYNCEKNSLSKQANPNLIENYFENIDSEEKAYWIGWIISDGAITNQPEKNKFQLEITIKKEDENILHILEKDLQVENKVYNSGEKYIRFSLGCKKIIQDLEKLGISQNKSFTVKIPKIDKQYNSSLIRGIFDGDGGFSSYHRTNGQNCQELSFCGNQFVITWILQTLLEEIPELKKISITNENSIKRIRWGSKKDITLIKNFLYKECNNHYLERKYKAIQANTEVTN